MLEFTIEVINYEDQPVDWENLGIEPPEDEFSDVTYERVYINPTCVSYVCMEGEDRTMIGLTDYSVWVVCHPIDEVIGRLQDN